MISIEIAGTPAPKGSMRAMLMRGRPIMIPGGSSANQRALNAWNKAIKAGVRAAIGELAAPPFVDRPLTIQLLFRLERPAGHWGARGLKPSAPQHPTVKPDIDKLARATLDALTGVLFDDDARIAALAVVKQWAQPGGAGVVITLDELPIRGQGSLNLTVG